MGLEWLLWWRVGFSIRPTTAVSPDRTCPPRVLLFLGIFFVSEVLCEWCRCVTAAANRESGDLEMSKWGCGSHSTFRSDTARGSWGSQWDMHRVLRIPGVGLVLLVVPFLCGALMRRPTFSSPMAQSQEIEQADWRIKRRKRRFAIISALRYP